MKFYLKSDRCDEQILLHFFLTKGFLIFILTKNKTYQKAMSEPKIVNISRISLF
jgi:hypothetical protein